MKRFCLVFAAIATLLTVGVGTAPASTTHAASKGAPTTGAAKAKPTTSKVSCSIKISTQVPDDSGAVLQGATSGEQYGTAGCGKLLGFGVQKNSFAQDDSGTWTGKVQQYFDAGSIFGKFTLTPDDSVPPTTTSFTSASYTGTLTVTGGTGAYKKVVGKAPMTCNTTDSEHFTCTDKFKLTLPGAA